MNTLDAALICKCLSDANRLQIVRMLAGGEQCACKLLEAFDITQPTLSYHMKNLTDCGLVNVRREGRWSHYSINAQVMEAFKAFVAGLTDLKS